MADETVEQFACPQCAAPIFLAWRGPHAADNGNPEIARPVACPACAYDEVVVNDDGAGNLRDVTRNARGWRGTLERGKGTRRVTRDPATKVVTGTLALEVVTVDGTGKVTLG